MKVTIFGAGAIGSHLAARLAQSGADVSMVARGPHLAAVQERGLRFIHPDESFTVPIRATSDSRELGPQDLVISTVKAHSLTAAADQIKSLLHDTTPIVFAVNGIPWWYFHKDQGARADTRLERLDPQGKLWNELGVERALGCVITSSNELVEPGVVQNHTRDNTFTYGEPDGTLSPRLQAAMEVLTRAMPYSIATTEIRTEIWKKLLANLASSSISSLTGARACDVASDPELTKMYLRVVAEGRAIAQSVGVNVEFDEARRFKRMQTSVHRPSMLQDLMAGRPMEIDAQLAMAHELARDANVPTPTLDTILALLIARASQEGLYTR